MKILKLYLKAFGPFTNGELDLSGGQQGFHLIYGPNEAGKSTTLRALRQMLYGIPGNSPDNFVHPYPQLRIGATLMRSDGAPFSFLRRKGNKNTLLAEDNKSFLEEKELLQFLGGMSSDVFTTMFGIDHHALVKGGEAIVEGHGEIGQILFLAGSGLSNLRSVQKQFQKECEQLFKPTGQNPAINAGLSQWKEARSEIRGCQLSSDDWSRLSEQIDQDTRQKQKIEHELRQFQEQRNRLERIHTALPDIARLCQSREELTQYADAPVLPADFPEKRRTAQTRLQIARSQAEQSRAKLQELGKALAELDIPEDLLTAEKSIEAFHLNLGSHNKAMSDRKERSAERLKVETAAKALLRELRPQLDFSRVDELRISRPLRVRVQEAGQKFQGLQAESRSASEQVNRLNRRIAELEEKASQLPPAREVVPLRSTLRRLQQLGPIEAQLVREEQSLQALRRQVETQLKKLPHWKGSADELEQLAIPTVTTIDHYQEQMDSLQQQIAKLCERIDEEETELRDLNRQIEQLRRSGDIPTKEQLKDAREQRGELWEKVKKAWHHPQSTPRSLSAASNEFDFGPDAEDVELAKEFEGSVEHSDDISDRLRREAHQVARQAELMAHRDKQLDHVERLKEQLVGQRAQLEKLKEEWKALWSELKIKPQSPKEMRSWRELQQALIQSCEQSRQQQTKVEQLAKQVTESRAVLLASLKESGCVLEKTPESLSELFDHAQRHIDEMDTLQQQRTRTTEDLAAAKEEFLETQQAAKTAEKNQQTWQANWSADMRQLGLPEDATPTQANDFMNAVDDLFSKLLDIDRLTERIEGMDTDAARFKSDVREFALRVMPELADRPVEECVTQLSHMLQQAKTDREQQQALLKQQRQEQQRLDDAESELRQREIELKSLCEQAGCECEEELPQAEEQSAKRQQIEKRIAELSERIMNHSGGLGLEEFLCEASKVNADLVVPEMNRLDEQIQERTRERDKLIESIATNRNELLRMDGSAKAAEAAERAEHLAAQLEGDLEQYVKVKLATELLRRGIERYREKHQGPVLKRASELFAQLTQGSFIGLRIDFDDQERSVLMGVRPGGEVTVSLNGMSDGTCDQLYLALRLAALESYLDQHEAMPFIVDDILVNFDSPRSLATLQALMELSRKTQVIFLTHHDHLVEIAKGHLDPEHLFVHSLRDVMAGSVFH